MKKKKIGISLFILAIVFLAWGFQSTITGNVISNNFLSYQSFFQGLGLAFLIGSVLVLTSKKSLDYLIIPTGQTEENPKRVEKALQEWDKDYIKRLTISGDAGKPLKDSERATIYKIVRKHKVKPKEIFISGGKDSKENINIFSRNWANLKTR